jgi:hypothetical protein
MPAPKNYHLFISHAWKYDEEYYALEALLKQAQNFAFTNYSVPKHDPLTDPETPVGKKKLEQMLDEQIRQASIVLVLSGMYVAYKRWIQYEIDQSVSTNKPIIGIKPRGQQQLPTAVTSVAKETVGWNTDSIVTAIRKYSIT